MTKRKLATVMASALLALVLGACGGSASTSSSSSPTAAASSSTSSHAATTSSTPSAATATTSKPAANSAKLHRHGKAKLHAAVYNPPPATTSTRAAISAAAALPPSSVHHPCRLVTATEAAAILHAPILRETEGSLGPTCLLELKGRRSVTFTVESVHLRLELAHMKQKPTRLSIGGHTAYCGVLGSPLLFVELGKERVLQVSAPCSAAEALAATALPRISA